MWRKFRLDLYLLIVERVWKVHFISFFKVVKYVVQPFEAPKRAHYIKQCKIKQQVMEL